MDVRAARGRRRRPQAAAGRVGRQAARRPARQAVATATAGVAGLHLAAAQESHGSGLYYKNNND